MAVPSQEADVISHDEVHIFSEFEDPERKAYIDAIVVFEPDLESISRFNLFLLWFADKEALRKMSRLEGKWNEWAVGNLLSGQPNPKYDIVGGTAMGKRSEDPDEERVSSHRDQNAAKKEMSLDKARNPGIDVAHIVPFKLHKSPRNRLWRLLESFWADDKLKTVQEEITGADGRLNTEKVTNMISLNCLVHNYRINCQCALRPARVSDDQLSMDIAFHWLPLQTGREDDMVRIDQNPYGDGAEQSISRSPGNNLLLFDYETERVIHSGEIFTISTTDKDERPLPSKDLLELLWLLKRVAAMQEAETPQAGPDDEYLETIIQMFVRVIATPR